MPVVAVAIILSALIGGTLTFEASKALPGDVLYPFKVSVNEAAEEALAASGTTKANVDLTLLEQRLFEARTLALTNKLDAYTQTTITQNIDEHAKSIAASVSLLQERGDYAQAAQIAGSLHAALSQQAAQLNDLSTQGGANFQASLAPILTNVRIALNNSSLLSAAASAKAADIGDGSRDNPASISAAADSGI